MAAVSGALLLQVVGPARNSAASAFRRNVGARSGPIFARCVIQTPEGFKPEAQEHGRRGSNTQVGTKSLWLLAGCWPTDCPRGPGEMD